MLSIIGTDAEIANVVRAAFNRSLLIPHEGISITAANGTVWLEGTVNWEFERMAAIDRALDVPGVGAVYNRLDVLNQPRRTTALIAPPDERPMRTDLVRY